MNPYIEFLICRSFVFDILIYIFGSYYYFIKPKTKRPKYWPIRILLASVLVSRAILTPIAFFTIDFVIARTHTVSIVYIAILIVTLLYYPISFRIFQRLVGVRHYILSLALCSTITLIENLTSVIIPPYNPLHPILFVIATCLCYLYKHKEFLYLVNYAEAKETIDDTFNSFMIFAIVDMTAAFQVGVAINTSLNRINFFSFDSLWPITSATLLILVCYLFIKASLQNIIRSIKNRQLQESINSVDKKIMESQEHMLQSQEHIIESFASILEEKSNESGGHVRRVAAYSTTIAMELGFSEEDSKKIGTASMMHDIGKILIPTEILEKPGKYTDEEFEIMKKHVIYGGQILQHGEGEIIKIARDIAAYHHECWDGSGYSGSLRGNAIPTAALIVAVADVFDALTSDRCYKKSWPIHQAKAEILANSGTKFSPEIVSAFERCFGKIKEIYYTNSSMESVD